MYFYLKFINLCNLIREKVIKETLHSPPGEIVSRSRGDDYMRGTHILICAMLCVALIAHSQNLAAHFEESEKDFFYSWGCQILWG